MLDKLKNSDDLRAYFNKYQKFKAAIRNWDNRKTEFWLKYLDLFFLFW